MDASANQLRAAGAASLRDMLKVNTTLTELNLSNNEVGGWYEYQTRGDFTATPEVVLAVLPEACPKNDWPLKGRSQSQDKGPSP